MYNSATYEDGIIQALTGKYIGNQLNMPGVCRCGTISAITTANQHQSTNKYASKSIQIAPRGQKI